MTVMRRLLIAVLPLFLAVLTACNSDNIDTAEQLKADMDAIDAYTAAHGLNAIPDQSGIRFVITKLGKKGMPPRGDQTIKAKYVGKFLDGTVFDDGSDVAEGPLNSFIAGWQYCLNVWPSGTQGILFVPSPLGYGNRTVNSIPANSILMFEITLNEVVLTNADKARFTSDTTAIEKYLSDHSIAAETDTTGVRYVIEDPGTGDPPSLYTKVKFNFAGTALTTGNEFYRGSSEPNAVFDSRVVDYLHGIKIGLMKVGKGGKVTVYIPSGLAFGPFENTQSALPANSNVKYEIELLEIY